MFKIYADLTKIGIVIFVLLSGLAGYGTAYAVESIFVWQHLMYFVAGLFFLSSGSLALNQVQEYEIDKKMPRTAKRPVASGKIKPVAAGILAVCYIVAGSDLLYRVSDWSGHLGLLTVFLYNVVYTYWWKPKMIYAAVPGAIPGALPVTIGYAANSSDIFSLESVYLFLILFLWQMPHFWALAIKFKDDYASAGVPTLPVALGIEKTLYQMGLYSFLYVIVAMGSPFFVHASWGYLALVIPFAFKILQEFFRFYKSKGTERWLAFFMWVNVSVLVFMYIPVMDKWNFLIIKSN